MISDSTIPSDVSLVRRSADGNEAAATDLYHRYAGRIHKLVRAKLSRELAPRIDADDIVQSVFRRFFGANERERYDLPTDENLWDLLLTITLNRVRTAEQFHRAEKRTVQKSLGPEALASLPAANDDGDAALELMVNEALDRLPAPHRALVHLRLDGYGIAEIAVQVGRSKRTVERMLQEVRDQLRTILDVEDTHDTRADDPD